MKELAGAYRGTHGRGEGVVRIQSKFLQLLKANFKSMGIGTPLRIGFVPLPGEVKNVLANSSVDL